MTTRTRRRQVEVRVYTNYEPLDSGFTFLTLLICHLSGSRLLLFLTNVHLVLPLTTLVLSFLRVLGNSSVNIIRSDQLPVRFPSGSTFVISFTSPGVPPGEPLMT